MMAAKKWMTCCLLLLVGQATAGIANAGHGGLEQPARRLENQADLAFHQVEDVFRHSRLLRAMSNEAYHLMDAASDIRQLSHVDAPIGRLRGKVIVARAHYRALENLVNVAERHAVMGIDAPMCVCIDGLRRQLSEICATLDCLEERVDDLHRGHHHRGGFDRHDHRRSGPPPRSRYGHSVSGFSIDTGSFRLHFGHH